MPLLPYVNRVEPSEDAVIWRFMDLRKFRDLMASEELYFRRADLFSDPSEGLPPEQYARRVLGLDPYDINDLVSLNNHLGSLAQNRESYYISCWHLYRQETLDMWEQYGCDGVAVCSRHGLLKSALDGLLDETHAGLVRYGTDHLATTFNALEFITTKQIQYSQDREIRVVSATIIGPFPELYFGPPYLIDNQNHPVSFLLFCLLPFFASILPGLARASSGLITEKNAPLEARY